MLKKKIESFAFTKIYTKEQWPIIRRAYSLWEQTKGFLEPLEVSDCGNLISVKAMVRKEDRFMFYDIMTL